MRKSKFTEQQIVAALRNAVQNLFRLHGWSRVADAVRHSPTAYKTVTTYAGT